MKKFIISIFCFLLLYSCSENEVRFNNLIERFQPDVIDENGESELELIANGSDSEFFRIFFNADADISKINATAKLTHNTFLETGNNELKITPYQDLDNPILKNKIIADISIVASTKNSPDRLTININQYERKLVIKSIRSNPATINLKSNSVSILNNFDSEILLTATLSSDIGKKVSQGTKVKFLDFLEDGSPAGGLFREQKLSSDSNSQVSTNYNIGDLAVNQNITITVEILDENDNPLSIKDSVKIFVKTIQ